MTNASTRRGFLPALLTVLAVGCAGSSDSQREQRSTDESPSTNAASVDAREETLAAVRAALSSFLHVRWREGDVHDVSSHIVEDHPPPTVSRANAGAFTADAEITFIALEGPDRAVARVDVVRPLLGFVDANGVGFEASDRLKRIWERRVREHASRGVGFVEPSRFDHPCGLWLDRDIQELHYLLLRRRGRWRVVMGLEQVAAIHAAAVQDDSDEVAALLKAFEGSEQKLVDESTRTFPEPPEFARIRDAERWFERHRPIDALEIYEEVRQQGLLPLHLEPRVDRLRAYVAALNEIEISAVRVTRTDGVTSLNFDVRSKKAVRNARFRLNFPDGYTSVDSGWLLDNHRRTLSATSLNDRSPEQLRVRVEWADFADRSLSGFATSIAIEDALDDEQFSGLTRNSPATVGRRIRSSNVTSCLPSTDEFDSVLVDVVIAGEGTVVDTRLVERDAPELARCLDERIGRLRFDPAPRRARIQLFRHGHEHPNRWAASAD